MRIRISCAIATAFAGAMMLGLAGAAPENNEGGSYNPPPDKDGYVSLFDGKSLDGWKIGKYADSWSVKDGCLVVHGPGPAHLFYVGPVHNHDWKNFHLRAEVKTFPHANSGIYFHTKYQESGWPDQGFESQVNCTHKDWKKTGSLYDIVNIKDPHHKDGEWFVYDIIVRGKHVELKINNETVCDWTEPDDFVPPKNHPGRFLQHGTFALQGHDPGSEVWFRNIVVKPLDD